MKFCNGDPTLILQSMGAKQSFNYWSDVQAVRKKEFESKIFRRGNQFLLTFFFIHRLLSSGRTRISSFSGMMSELADLKDPHILY